MTQQSEIEEIARALETQLESDGLRLVKDAAAAPDVRLVGVRHGGGAISLNALARAAYEVMARSDGWLPIESAPKDTWVLLYLPEEGAMGCLHAGCHRKISNGHMWIIGHHFASDLTPATHWRPLPDPPSSIRELPHD